LDQGVPSIEQVTLTSIYKSFILCIPKKQSSKNAIAAYEVNKKNSLAKTISNNNALTAQVLEANTIQSFATALQNMKLQ
jgi:hypothetical protein